MSTTAPADVTELTVGKLLEQLLTAQDGIAEPMPVDVERRLDRLPHIAAALAATTELQRRLLEERRDIFVAARHPSKLRTYRELGQLCGGLDDNRVMQVVTKRLEQLGITG